MFTLKRLPLAQLYRFTIIGTVAAITNLLGVIILVETTHLHPLTANIFAFLLAFMVSYTGHRHWTFAHTKSKNTAPLPRFFLVAVTGLVSSEFFYYILLSLKLNYIVALLIVMLVIPPLTFLISKTWAFK